MAFTLGFASLSSDDQQSADGVLGLEWKVFRFRVPETLLTSNLVVLPAA